MKTTHNLDFESSYHLILGNLFRVGTCEGQWGSTSDSYYILSVVNKLPNNGHLIDVFELFENSCKRDNKNLLVLYCMNKAFMKHLIDKRGFVALNEQEGNVIKVFNEASYSQLLQNGNELLHAKTMLLR